MKQGFSIAHSDHAYVERNGGFALLTHLRGAEPRARYRTMSLERALARFRAAEDARQPESTVGGLGLVVLQRALLGVEDLGGLLHAFSGEDPWRRLVRSNAAHLDRAFEHAVRNPDSTIRDVFLLPAPEALRDEDLSAEEAVVLQRLRSRTASRWRAMLSRAAVFWLSLRRAGKATMHGFPFVAGEHIVGPPAAGELADHVNEMPPGRFALGLFSKLTPPSGASQGHALTETFWLPLMREAVEQYRHDAVAALRLYSELAELRATATMNAHAATIPLALTATLPDPDRDVLRALLARTGRE